MAPDNTTSERICSKCGQLGPCRNGHLQCQKCERAYSKLRYLSNHERTSTYRQEHREHYRKMNREGMKRKKAERHAAIQRIKDVPCTDCGKQLPYYMMDFDHRDPSTKTYEISHLLNKTCKSWTVILEEIAKCDVVCVCCHRLRTFQPPQNTDGRRHLIMELKNVPCTDCGEHFHYCQMDFDHVRGEKKCYVPRAKSRAKILAEAAKCDVVCANCHRGRTQQGVKGCQRNRVEDLNMVWQRNNDKGPRMSVAVPRQKRDTPAFRSWHKLAGKMLDVDVALQGQVTSSSVCIYRKRMGIPRYKEGSHDN